MGVYSYSSGGLRSNQRSSGGLFNWSKATEKATSAEDATSSISATRTNTWRFEDYGSLPRVQKSPLLHFCLLATSAFLFGVYIKSNIFSARSVSICTTPGCVIAASELLRSLSPNFQNIDPCDDFRTFVCEGWDLRNDLRDDQSDIFTGTIMKERSDMILRHLLESPPLNETKGLSGTADTKNFEKLQNAYKACMDDSKVKGIGSIPLLEILGEISKLFPAARPGKTQDPAVFPTLTNQQNRGFLYTGEGQLSNVLNYLMSIGVQGMLSWSVEADERNPEHVVVYLNAPRKPGLPSKEYYEDESIMQSYGRTVGQVLEALLKEATPNSTDSEIGHSRASPIPGFSGRSEELISSLLDFEKKLAQASPNNEDAEDVTKYYNPRTIEETHEMLPQISVESLILHRTGGYVPKSVVIGSPSYLKKLSEVLRGTSKETVQAYLVWKTVQFYQRYIEDDAIIPLRRFENELQGKDPESKKERWRTCVSHVDESLGWILSRFYVEKTFSRESKIFGDRIISDIKDQFVKKIRATEWMSEEVKIRGIEKVHNIAQKIGYPTKSPNIEDPDAVQNYYAAVNISQSTFFGNTLSTMRFATNLKWSRAGKPTNHDEWIMSAPTVNAYYNPTGNEIVFPAGIMQEPVFYSPDIPQYLSYGAFGSVSGHELSHAFDSSGRHYDQHGRFTDWWDNSTTDAFRAKAQCFVNQYHNFTVPGPDNKPLHVNGRLTLGENIADAGGLSASFAAWKERELISPALTLPGLQDFTKEQLFFISYGNWWCGKTRRETQVDKVYTDPHAPTFARILGTVSNSPEFLQSFSCLKKTPNCKLW